MIPVFFKYARYLSHEGHDDEINKPLTDGMIKATQRLNRGELISTALK
jgi:hypothetical protein